MAFVSNFNSGKISQFSRNTTTGKLKLQGTVAAGSKKGPKGMAITPNNSFLYAANFADGDIEEYSIRSNGSLVSLGHVSDGTGSGPSMIAMDPGGSFLWVTNESNGTISEWSIGPTGALTSIGTVSGLVGPFGIVVTPDGSIVYVSDNTTGLIYTYAIDPDGTLARDGIAVPSLPSGLNGSPGLMVIDPTGSFLYVDDIANGVVSLFNIANGAPVIGANYPSTFNANAPVGMGIASLSSATYVLTVNQNAGNTWAFQVLGSGILNTPISSGTVSQPTGLAIDAQNLFAYTADQGDGTVGIFQLDVACPNAVQPLCQIETVATEATPPSDGSAPFYVVLTN